MAIEVDFLAVGDESKSGDAIAFRYGNLTGGRAEWICVVVDGGNKAAGDQLSDFIRNRYVTDYVDVVVNTHPDADHASGLERVLENLRVGQLWMHRSWARSNRLRAALERQPGAHPITEAAMASLDHARELERIANRKGIPIFEPFAGHTMDNHRGRITVLGPSEEYYNSLLPDIGRTRQTSMIYSTLGRLVEGGVALAARVMESLDLETLVDPADDATSSSNNSSVILLIENDGEQVLLTADAGVPALDRAEDFASSLGVDLKSCGLQQIPHHGSRRNMGPTMLDALVGPRYAQRDPISVYVSAAKKGRPKHPNVRVTNAYMRRGAKAFSTEGVGLCWSRGATPPRRDYGPATSLPFHEGEVEGDDE